MRVEELNDELETLTAEARELEEQISRSVENPLAVNYVIDMASLKDLCSYISVREAFVLRVDGVGVVEQVDGVVELERRHQFLSTKCTLK